MAAPDAAAMLSLWNLVMQPAQTEDSYRAGELNFTLLKEIVSRQANDLKGDGGALSLESIRVEAAKVPTIVSTVETLTGKMGELEVGLEPTLKAAQDQIK